MKYFEQEITALTYSNITQNYPSWDSETVYTYEDDDSLTSASVVEHKNYYWRSATINNTDEPSEKSLKWAYLNGIKELSVSNKYALLDENSSTQTVSEGEDLVLEFERGSITTIVVGRYEAAKVTVVNLDELGNEIPETEQEFIKKPTAGIISWFTYWFDKKVYETAYNQRIEIYPTGEKIRITLTKTPTLDRAAVGFLYGGRPLYTGVTVDDVVLSFDSSKFESDDGSVSTSATTTNATFSTQAPRESTTYIKRRITSLKQGMVACFIIDDTDSTLYDNIIILGELQSAPITIDSFDQHITNWTVYEKA